jgi:hypothetical protein
MIRDVVPEHVAHGPQRRRILCRIIAAGRCGCGRRLVVVGLAIAPPMQR